MARVEIAPSLAREIKKKFKGESRKIVELLETLEENPKKGKPLGIIAGILISGVIVTLLSLGIPELFF